jgi:hypothetical protein
MIRLIAVAFALALASSVEAMPPVSIQPSDQLVTQVRQRCGAGMVRRAGVCVPRGGIAAGGSTNLAGGYANSPGYTYGPGPGPAYGPGPGPAYGPGYGAGPGYASSTNLAGGYANSPGYAYGPRHDIGGPARMGNMCWSDRDPWANTGQGYWKAC